LEAAETFRVVDSAAAGVKVLGRAAAVVGVAADLYSDMIR
jgi:hypothetical protein